MARARRPESDHERGIVAPLYGGCGFSVYATSARVHPIGVTPGIPDLIVLAGDPLKLTFFHETKVGARRQTSEQFAFMRDACDAGSCYVLGDASSAQQFLCFLGIAVPVNETVRFWPRDRWAARSGLIDPASIVRLAREWWHSTEFREHRTRWGYRA